MGTELTKPRSRRSKIKRLLRKGYDLEDVVDKLAGDDQVLRKKVRSQLAVMIQRDPETQELIGMQTQGELILDLPSAARALGRRASKGNVPAIKLLFESSGFWSPKQTQEHVGEIQITVKGVPRPEPVSDDSVVDATVVED